jgi:hypothetical protein
MGFISSYMNSNNKQIYVQKKLKLKSNKNLAMSIKPASTAPIKINGTRETYKDHISTSLQNWQNKLS